MVRELGAMMRLFFGCRVAYVARVVLRAGFTVVTRESHRNVDVNP